MLQHCDHIVAMLSVCREAKLLILTLMHLYVEFQPHMSILCMFTNFIYDMLLTCILNEPFGPES